MDQLLILKLTDMLTQTHLLAASSTYLAFGSGEAAGIFIAAGAALLPDLDTKQSIVGRLLPFVSGPIALHFGHRTITHSLLFQILVGYVAWLLLPRDYAIAIIAGLVSHAMIDMLTLSGVCWFWPSRIRCVLPGSAKYRFETGSWAELVFAIAMAVTSFGLVWLHQSTEGTAGVIRTAIGDIAVARNQYDEQKGQYAFSLRIQGKDNSNFSVIEDDLPVIAAWGASGFLVEKSGEAASVCKSEGCDIFPEHAVLVSHGSIQITTQELKIKRLSFNDLHAAMIELSEYGKVYVSGHGQGKIEPNTGTVKLAGDKTTLYYASVQDTQIRGYLKNASLVLQTRHAPGITVRYIEIER